MRVELETKTLINHSLDIHKTLLHYIFWGVLNLVRFPLGNYAIPARRRGLKQAARVEFTPSYWPISRLMSRVTPG